MAPNAIDFLMREFELEYLSCCLCFFTGIITYMLSLALRAYTEFVPKLALATSLLFCTNTFMMFSFFNKQYHLEWGYIGMVARVLKLSTSYVSLSNPLAFVALATGATSMYFLFDTLLAMKKKSP